MKTAQEYLRDALGDLMVQNALLRAEVEQLQAALAEAQQARPAAEEPR
jgi:uncharacterized small protein (DUF1192 family)